MTLVRCACETDLDTVIALWSELIAYHHDLDDRFWVRAEDGEQKARAWMMEALVQPNRLLLVAEREEAVVGFLHGMLRNAPVPMAPRLSGCITDVIVSEQAARRGAGTALLAAAEEWFLAQGAEDVATTVAVCNHRGR